MTVVQWTIYLIRMRVSERTSDKVVDSKVSELQDFRMRILVERCGCAVGSVKSSVRTGLCLVWEKLLQTV